LVRWLKNLSDDIVNVAAPEQELPSLAATLARDEVAYRGIYYGMKAPRAKLVSSLRAILFSSVQC
jgi:hypothetical protein